MAAQTTPGPQEGATLSAGRALQPAGVEAIIRISEKLRAVANEEEAGEVITAEVRSAVHADYCALFLIDEAANRLRVVGISGVQKETLAKLPPVQLDPSFRAAFKSGERPKVVRMDGIESFPPVARPFAEALNVQTGIVSAVVARGNVLGYLGVATSRSSPEFPPETEVVLSSVADYVAVAIESMENMAALLRAKQETEQLVTHAPIAMFTCDARGIFMSVNKQMLEILERRSAEELVGTSVFEIPAVIKSGIDALVVQGMEGHEGEKVDIHFVPRPDRAYYLHARVTPIRSDRGDVERVLFVAMDVTSKVRLQNQLERSYEKLTQTYQELERVNMMKTQFIDIVSHELRTPLTVMRGYLELMESEYASKLDKKFASRLATIKANTDRLYTLVENMLDVSRLEKGSLQIHPELVRIEAILEEVVQQRMKDAEGKHQTLSVEVEGQLSPVMADRRRIKDVFNNILDNAIRYTQEGGRIQVGARDEGRIIHIWFKDNGIGIPLENLGRIFDRFHIVTSNDLSHQVDRLGLGLPISKGIVEAHGGRLWVESQVGKGSVFHINLPK